MVATESKTVDAILQRAIALHQTGQLQQAEQLYRTILQTQPNHSDANHNLGLLAGHLGKTTDGLSYLKIALETNPSHWRYWHSYADALLACNKVAESLAILGSAIQHGLDTQEILSLQQKATTAANTHTVKEEGPTAVEHHQLIALFNAACYAELESHVRVLLEQYPHSGFCWNGLGAALQMQGKDARPALQKATELMSEDAEAHNNLGNAFQDYGEFNHAITSYRRALEIKPDFVEAHFNLGKALQDLGQLNGAASSYEQALAIRPDFAEAYNNLGIVLHNMGNVDEAFENYRLALSIKPDFVMAHSNMLYMHSYLADQSSAMSMAAALRFGELVTRQVSPSTAWPNIPNPARCLRIGLVSGDLREHPVGFFLENVLVALVGQAVGQLEFFAYPTQVGTDAISERIKACCTGWHCAVRLADDRFAQKIRDDGIDILIDLSGHTAHNRLAVFAYKPAPVQVSWLGYFATTGVKAIDYLLADPWTLPEAEELNFTEKIWRLPETRLCFTPPNIDLPVNPLPALSNGYITFGCFNNLAKMNDAVVTVWAQILLSIPASRLLLKAKQLSEPSARHNTTERFASYGITADRIILEGPSPRVDYLASYQHVDIALDPFPYTGGTTSVESLWMGVPVLTLAGDRFLSRQGVGLMMNANLAEWIASNTDDYVARAVAHASDLQCLAGLRTRLRHQVINSPIFDAPRFAMHFETVMRGMWQKWCE